MPESIQLAFTGAAGRMGQRLVALAHAAADLHVAVALERRDHPNLGRDAGVIAGVGEIGTPLTDAWASPPDCLIDFSTPAGAMRAVELCSADHVPLVLATTGLSEEEQSRVRTAAGVIPVLWAPNMSLAVNLGMKLVAVAADALKADAEAVDVEIIERHHRYKEDAPSGTALRFGEIVAEAMGQTQHTHGREGRPGVRPRGEIGYHALRVGDDPGQHTIVFGLLGETLEVTVKATSRDAYAYGALAAARYLVGKPAGMYSINDVLGL
ncbi:MAG: 4-hydroxy-tetrahydrodipicolinate reductase [Pirellulales bacterium]|nr:4-hydroxy-tetrahydrodipicolinate reductase [Planctomycetales bacterium]